MAYLEALAAFGLLVLGIIVTLYPIPTTKKYLRVGILAAFTMLGLATCYLSVARYETPNVDIVSGPPLSPGNPFDTPFKLVNNGEAAIWSVSTVCSAGAIASGNGSAMQNIGFSTTPTIVTVEPHQPKTIGCFIMGRQPLPAGAVTGADVTLIVTFHRPWFYFFTKTEVVEQRFLTVKASNGEFAWIPPLQ